MRVIPFLLAVALLNGCGSQPVVLPAGAAAAVAQAKSALPGMPVKGRAPLTGYQREQFMVGWADADGDGCSTRDDVLLRDLRQPVLKDSCSVAAGALLDPYSGSSIEFRAGPGSSDEVQIDHVVALANAWQTGAQTWTAAQRAEFANDARGLLAVDGGQNQRKGAGDAATWLPPNKGFRCQYVAMQVLIKQRWGLWLTPPEKAAVEGVLQRC